LPLFYAMSIIAARTSAGLVIDYAP